ncbi:uncharacterized protein VTP21DRAFT_1500, partial [Calcarisporiella thermophila]|uniref:uncharacterized protein n=1 Tax=Calcarisporiella thermophila TaxID=911321 RepID=UPI0037445AF9
MPIGSPDRGESIDTNFAEIRHEDGGEISKDGDGVRDHPRSEPPRHSVGRSPDIM